MQKQVPCLVDNTYNLTNQLSRTLNFLARVDHYIADANRCGDSEAEKVWQTIKSDRQRHTDLLKGLIATEVKNNRF